MAWLALVKTTFNIMEKAVKEEVKKTSKKKEVFTTSEQIENLITEFKSIEKTSENILVSIQHLESVKKLLEKETLNIEVVDSEVV